MMNGMVFRVVSLLLAAPLLAFGAAASGQPDNAVKVNKRPATVRQETFNPRNKPANMPKLGATEAADCQSQFGVGCQVGVEITQDNDAAGQHEVTVKVENIAVSTTLAITVWLPTNATAQLKAHEEGHRKIAESFYKNAEEVARAAAGDYVGKSLAGRGKTTEAAANAAINQAISNINGKYMAATQIPSAKVNDAFDQITNHGRKNIPVDKAIETAMEKSRNQ
jgi:hypothetical protein